MTATNINIRIDSATKTDTKGDRGQGREVTSADITTTGNPPIEEARIAKGKGKDKGIGTETETDQETVKKIETGIENAKGPSPTPQTKSKKAIPSP